MSISASSGPHVAMSSHAMEHSLNETVMTYLPAVRRLVRSVYASVTGAVELDDLVQVGLAALIEASGNFVDRGEACFATYATRRIRGAMIDETRKLATVSRRALRRRRELQVLRSRLHGERGRAPTTAELAQSVGMCQSASKTTPLMTDQVIDQALAWLAKMPKLFRFSVAINLSPRLLGNLSLADLIEAKCHHAGVDPAQITLEITESSAMDDPIAGLAVTTRFCMKAFKLSIDDFDVGYSSLVQLARLPFSELKIDRQFVMYLSTSIDNRAIFEAIVLLAHRLGLSVTAEGVENPETLHYLAAIGCDVAQGYAIARPMDADTARA